MEDTSFVFIFLNQIKSQLTKISKSPIFFNYSLTVLPPPMGHTQIPVLWGLRSCGKWRSKALPLPFACSTVAVEFFRHQLGLLLWVGYSYTFHSRVTLTSARSIPHLSPACLEYCLHVLHRCKVRPRTQRNRPLPSPGEVISRAGPHHTLPPLLPQITSKAPLGLSLLSPWEGERKLLSKLILINVQLQKDKIPINSQ